MFGGVAHVFQKTQREVVLRDGAQMRARVGKARMRPRAGDQLLDNLGTVIAVVGLPLQRVAVLLG